MCIPRAHVKSAIVSIPHTLTRITASCVFATSRHAHIHRPLSHIHRPPLPHIHRPPLPHISLRATLLARTETVKRPCASVRVSRPDSSHTSRRSDDQSGLQRTECVLACAHPAPPRSPRGFCPASAFVRGSSTMDQHKHLDMANAYIARHVYVGPGSHGRVRTQDVTWQ